MFTNYNKNYFLLVLILLIGFISFAQLSKTHYIPPLTNAQFGNANPEDQYIYISTPNAVGVNFTITPIGGIDINGFVSNSAPYVHSIAFGNGQLFIPSSLTSTVINNRGYIIKAEAPIYVSVRMQAGRGSQAGALVSKGISALDTTFRIGSFTNENPQDNYLSFVSVMASEDNTQVTFDNLPVGLVIKNYSGTTPITITLNEGESYTVAVNSFDQIINNRDGLIGCLVTSDKAIVVNCGSANGSFGNGRGRDYGIDQIVGLSKIGNEYIFVKGGGDNDWENILIVPHTAGTTVKINGGAAISITEPYYLIEGNQYANDNMYVETSNPVFAYQGVGSTSEANQGMFFVPPLSCETRGNIDNIVAIDNIGSTIYNGGISIVSKVGATVTVNNLPLTNFSTVGPTTVTGKPDYITYKVTGLNNNVSVQGDDELYVAYFNVNGSATSGSFYSGFPTIPEINFKTNFATLGNCIPNITLEAANARKFDSYEWFFYDGTAFQPVPSSLNAPSITPTIATKYKLIGTIICTGKTLESVEIPVSICPDDTDNDGIIDNIDIDNDNDGILNCTESRGDASFNLLGIDQSGALNTHTFTAQDGTINTTITTSNYKQSSVLGGVNSFTGNIGGDFTSSLSADNDARNEYSMFFSQSVNVKLSESAITHNSVDGEFFIAKILPLNKNITLVDPDDRLLIDSNFDGIFEPGVTQFSGSEIHFRINPTPSGNTPYTFFANQVNGFSFIHSLLNKVDASTFTANISLTCFKKDTDFDGIEDNLDLDSDNDGIPDFIENTGTIIPLSNTDVDLNGLDDAYDILASPIDSDNDRIPDYYDLDSDNDGIYDLVETRKVGLLSDTDSNGIEDGPTYGLNGWADAAESAPDSGIIESTFLNEFDIDTDTVFNYIDWDSDGDLCSDVVEAGFSDANNDNYLDDNNITDGNVTVNTNGVVIGGLDGYILPNTDYVDGAPITITTQPVNPSVVCESSDILILVISPEAEIFQWEEKTPTGAWTIITDGTNYSGSQTSDLNLINTPIAFNGNQYRVKLDRTGNSCGLYSDIIELTVDQLPVANTALTMRLCDDDNNGTMSFDLTSQNTTISSTANVIITYHESQADADAGTPMIPDFSDFESGNTTVYARVENNNNTTCYDISSFNIEVYSSAFPLDSANIIPIQECDNTTFGTDIDSIIEFDLTQRETDILNGQSNLDFTLTYYTDTAYLNQIPTPSTYINNSSPGTQTIYVRVTNNLFTDCYTDTSFEIEVFERPQVNIPDDYNQCDDDSNDRIASFNLTLDWIKEDISPNYISEGLTFSYFDNQIEAENNGIAISNPTNYLSDLNSPTTETVYIRVDNPNGCHRVVPLILSISPSSGALLIYTPTPIHQCDDGTDFRDAVATFNMTSISNHISNVIFNTIDVTVHFYENETDAQLETNEILDISNHQNANSPVTQNIWVRVKSNLGNNCLGLKEFKNLLVVVPLPVANTIPEQVACDDGSDTTGINDNIHVFNTSLLEANILRSQSLVDVNITYWDSNGNPLLDYIGNPIVSPFPVDFITNSQTITAIVENNITSASNGPCTDKIDIVFTIYKKPIAIPITIPAACDDGKDNTTDINDNKHNFNLSGINPDNLRSDNTMDIYFSYTNEDGNFINRATSLPNNLISENQNIYVEIENPKYRSCKDFFNIQLIVNPIPFFIINKEETLCSVPIIPIDLIPNQQDSSRTYNYQWIFEDGTTKGTDRVLPNVSQPGNYTIIMTDPLNNCSYQETVSIKASELAEIELNDIEVNDRSEINTVTINNVSSLGSGTYQFSLVSREPNNNTTYPFQDSPVFYDVRAGLYTLLVKDETCGPVSLNISVLGHPKFFTPNGDGKNDYWQIKGVDAFFHSTSNIFIFDRYGKLLKQIRPFTLGWDGSVNGKIMPSDDYWFKVLLESGETFMGHFTLKR